MRTPRRRANLEVMLVPLSAARECNVPLRGMKAIERISQASAAHFFPAWRGYGNMRLWIQPWKFLRFSCSRRWRFTRRWILCSIILRIMKPSPCLPKRLISMPWKRPIQSWSLKPNPRKRGLWSVLLPVKPTRWMIWTTKRKNWDKTICTVW